MSLQEESWFGLLGEGYFASGRISTYTFQDP